MFDKTLAIRLGFACQYAYAKSDFLIDRLGLKGAAPVSYQDKFQPPTSFATVFSFDDHSVLAFQGTITRAFPDIAKYDLDAAKDWLQNFRVALVNTDHMKFHVPGLVHKGFAEQLDWIYDDLRTALAAEPGKPIYITGHSQRGAVAAIATKALVNDGFPIAATYTFAAPRAGDATFAGSISTEVHRLEFGDDIVPHVPPRSPHAWMLKGLIDRANLEIKMSQLMGFFANLANVSYTPVGLLTYGRPPDSKHEDGVPNFDMGASEESHLAKLRLLGLFLAKADLANHHHMFNYLHYLLGVDMNDAKNIAVAAAVAEAGNGPGGTVAGGPNQ